MPGRFCRMTVHLESYRYFEMCLKFYAVAAAVAAEDVGEGLLSLLRIAILCSGLL